MLVTARACQGVFAALLAPSALSLLTTTFTDPKERGKAFGVYGAVAASGSGLGLLIGGALTSYASWRWCMYINLVFAAIAITGGLLLLGRQARAAHPLVPPRVIADRNRGGAYLTMLIFGSGLFGIFLFLIYYMQLNLGYSAVLSGVALLPMVAAIGVMANVGNIALMPRFGPKPLVIAGLLANAGSAAGSSSRRRPTPGRSAWPRAARAWPRPASTPGSSSAGRSAPRC